MLEGLASYGQIASQLRRECRAGQEQGRSEIVRELLPHLGNVMVSELRCCSIVWHGINSIQMSCDKVSLSCIVPCQFREMRTSPSMSLSLILYAQKRDKAGRAAYLIAFGSVFTDRPGRSA